MTQDFSPEEKLLRLIRGERKQKESSVVGKSDSSHSSTEKSSAEIRAVKGERGTSSMFGGERKYSKFINMTLMAMLIATTAFFIYDLISSKPQQGVSIAGRGPDIASQEFQSTVKEKESMEQQTRPVPFSSYAESIGKRELFRPIKTEVQKEKAKIEKKSETAEEKLKNLSLIGIVSGETPQAIIEDKKNQKTYFLNKGQTVNQMTLEDILSDRVILNFEGEKFELAL